MKYILQLCVISCLFVVGHLRILNLPKGAVCNQHGVQGVCVAIEFCITAVFIDLRENPDDILHCRFEGNTPIVCCTDCDSGVTFPATQFALTPDGLLLRTNGFFRSWDNCVDFIDQLPYKCKEDSDWELQRVLDETRKCFKTRVALRKSLVGHKAERGEFPYMALLGYGAQRADAQWLCGGSIVSERYILTAAHCQYEPRMGAVKYIALGILKRTDPPSLWRHYDIEKIVPHPGYQYPSTYHDLALIRTTARIQFERNVLPICFAHINPPNGDGIVAGWGALGPNKPLADQLQTAWLTKYEESECSGLYPASRRHRATGINHTTQFCYGDREGDQDTCQGDSGGPLLIYGFQGQYCADALIGVTSNGRQCGTDHNAGVYVRLLPYLDWIQDIVWPRK